MFRGDGLENLGEALTRVLLLASSWVTFLHEVVLSQSIRGALRHWTTLPLHSNREVLWKQQDPCRESRTSFKR